MLNQDLFRLFYCFLYIKTKWLDMKIMFSLGIALWHFCWSYFQRNHLDFILKVLLQVVNALGMEIRLLKLLVRVFKGVGVGSRLALDRLAGENVFFNYFFHCIYSQNDLFNTDHKKE